MAKKVNKLEDKIKERNKLYVTGKNPKRLKELKEELNYIYYGIKENS